MTMSPALYLEFLDAGADTGGGFSPVDLPGLVGWFDAGDPATLTVDVDGKVSGWADKGGSGQSAVSGGGSRPVANLAGLNGLTTLGFDAASSNRMIGTTFPPVPQPLTVSYLARNTTPATPNGGRVFASEGILDVTHNGGNAGEQTALGYSGGAVYVKGPADAYASAAWGISTVVFNGAGSIAYANGVPGVAANPGPNGLGAIRSFGARHDSSFFLTGDIAEVVMYSRVLTATERQQVEGYLADKWGF